MSGKALPSRLDSLIRKLKKDEDGEILAVLAEALIASAQAEDLIRLSTSDLEWLVRRVHAFIARRQPGHGKVEIMDPDVPSLELSTVTVTQALNDNMPFLVDSLLGYLAEKGLEVRLLLHPVIHVERDAKGNLLRISHRATDAPHGRAESIVHLHTRRLSDDERTELARDIREIHADVRAAVLDWPAMRQRVEDVIAEYQSVPPPVPVEELTEVLAFLQWLVADHFVFLGVREHVMKDGAAVSKGAGLGILRRAGAAVDETGDAASPDGVICQIPERETPILITKSALTSRVHRRVPMDLIIIRRYDAAGEVTGELRIVGLFASAAYVRAARDIPLVRRKIDMAMRMSGLDRDNHLGKALLNILETFPRDELFELDAETLSRIAMGILGLEERPRPRVFVWRGCSSHYISAFVYVPRDRFSSQLRERIGEVLETALSARIVNFTPSFPEGVMVRVHYRLEVIGEGPRTIDAEEIEQAVIEVVRTWEDRLFEEMRKAWGERRAERLARLYRGAFSQAWQEAFDPRSSLHDLEIIERLDDTSPLAVSLLHTPGDAPDMMRLKLYHLDSAVPLSVRVPILANAGLEAIEERTFVLHRGERDEAREIFVHEVALRTPDGRPVDLDTLGPKLEEAFLAIWNGLADDDRFNALVVAAGLDWRQVSVLRAIARWMRQATAPYTTGYIADTLRRHPELARRLIDIFETLFRPGRAGRQTRLRKAKVIRKEVLAALSSIQSLDEDRILRMYLATLFAMRRTNFWQGRSGPDGRPAPLTFKLSGEKVEFLPEPKPWAEIFVHAPDVEGVHLRGGPVARGGIRWSDRLQDFRTEILGLAKAQNVKNAVIVPVGAKGGFVVRRPPRDAGRDGLLAAGQAAYRRFISAMLDITDNIVDGEIVPPERVVRLDDDDPYLVVAADKGTATFSDIANAIAADHRFWLGDAFASGGSAGYDHKKMGITARGAWEAVKRHFREMDIDIQKTPVDVIGVGDMSGDVFGNGMLLSKKIRLIAAFDHRDIFIDPDPDPAVSWKERRRLFQMPRSSWQDYDRRRISKGGGVYSRKAKSIRLSPEARQRLGIDAEELTPTEVIRAILKAPADLLWLGGIGTYVRATSERDADVGDTANDPLRITAPELRVKVVGEGANLGFTQKARIEYAMLGGRINTDAVDNSAGVNTSDMEVNMKIALAVAERTGRLTHEERNRLLAEMEPDVATLVLRNNYLQTLCLSMASARAEAETGDMIRLMHGLERRGALDRKLEDLPSDAELADRRNAGKPLTRPELAVLMSYAKIVLFDDLLACGVTGDPYFRKELLNYFPPLMRERFEEEIDGHRLRSEIIANRVGNAMINHGGPAFVSRMMEETGQDVKAIARAFALSMSTFDMPDLLHRIDRLDGRMPGADQLRLYLLAQRALRRATAWFLRNETLEADLDGRTEHWHARLAELDRVLEDTATSHARRRLRLRREEFQSLGVPLPLARRLARLPYLLRGLDIVLASRETEASLAEVAAIYFLIGHELQISPVMMAARRLAPASHYERLARNRLTEKLAADHRELTTAMARLGRGREALEAWRQLHGARLERMLRVLSGIMAERPFDLPRLSLAVTLFDELVEATRPQCD